MKTLKLSLIAAIAASGISVANAQDLASAIKNVEVSGTVVYRYNDYEPSTSTTNYYKLATSLKSKINNDVTFNSRFIAGDGTTDPISLNTSTSADKNIDIQLTEVNFTYTGLANTAITLGKQAISSPFTITRSSIGDEQVGTGIAATTSIGDTTFTAAYFNQTNFATSGNATSLYAGNEGADLIHVGVKTSIAGVNLDAHYADSVDIFDAYTLGLNTSGNISDVKLSAFARYSELDLDDSDKKNSLWKVGVKASTGIYGAFLAYGQTHKDGGVVGLDDGADVGFDEHWRVTLTGISDASTVYASINAQVTEKLNLALKYSDLDAGDNSSSVDQTETYLQASYKMSSNFKGYLRFGELDKDGSETATIGRLNIQYSF